jgi:hypothetical protein
MVTGRCLGLCELDGIVFELYESIMRQCIEIVVVVEEIVSVVLPSHPIESSLNR